MIEWIRGTFRPEWACVGWRIGCDLLGRVGEPGPHRQMGWPGT
ncbi:hypothetical protein X962_5647 [Burkholderia pseudomallei MSHR7343]|nr:hypothetical protein X962_5647 [Burkholderia pseudomallei MSHR7343]